MKFRYFIIPFLLFTLPTVASAVWTQKINVFRTDWVGDVVFEHAAHLKTPSIHCTSCHNCIFNIDPSKNPGFTMTDMGKGEGCGACHNGEIAFSVKTNCAACHKDHDIVFQDPSMGEVVFSHKEHTAMFGCNECHPRRFIAGPWNKKFTMADMEKGEACGGCHNGDLAFSVKSNCADCHMTHDIHI